MKSHKFLMASIIAYLFVWGCFVIGIVYVAYHFITKFW
jgi:hypothetical protein